MVFCPHCFVACAVPAERSLDGVACVSCLRPLAPEPGHRASRALGDAAEWWDRSRAGGAGFGIVTCPRCETSCVVPVGGPLAATGCIGCFEALGPGPLLRFDLGTDMDDEDGNAPEHDSGRTRLSPAA
jgi:hypothetical protein